MLLAIRLPDQPILCLWLCPPTAPNSTRFEQIFRVLHHRLVNRIFETLDDLQEALMAELEQFCTKPDVLNRLVGYPWWIESLLSL